MAFTSPTDDICIQEGTFAFSYTCSGSVSAGQAVHAIGTMQVKSIPATSVLGHGCVGVAAYDQTDGKMVAAYGPGNICRVIVSGTATAVGDVLNATYEGKFSDAALGETAHCSGVNAIALETQATNNGTCRVMLY